MSINTLKCFLISDNRVQEVENTVAIKEVLNSIQKNKMTFFLGAGASAEYPTCLPLGYQLIDILRYMVLDSANIRIDSFGEKEQAELKGLALEVFLDFYCRILGENALEFYDILKSKSYSHYAPNFRHYFLALLALYGYCRHIITVNFDTAIEEAFRVLDISLLVPENHKEEEQIYNSHTPDSSKNWLFKLHGSLSDELDLHNRHLLATVERVGICLPKYKRDAVKSIVEDYDIMFVGYDHKTTDIDVFPAIADAPSDRKVFWCVYSNDLGGIDKISPNIKRFISDRDGYILLTRDITGFYAFLLRSLSIEFSDILKYMGVESLGEIYTLEGELIRNREREWRGFAQDYRTKYFSTPAPAYLILANIMQKPFLWKTADKLLEKCMDVLPDNDYNLRYAFALNQAEVCRNDGRLSEAIKARRVALGFLDMATFEPRTIMKNKVYLLVRNGSDFMGLFKASSKKMVKIESPVDLYLSLTYFYKAVSQFFCAYRYYRLFASDLNEFDRGNFNSILNFEIADFCQFIIEGLLYLSLMIRTKNKMVAYPIRRSVYWPALISEHFYRRSLKKESAQSADWYFFQMHRLAEVVLHRQKKLTSELSKEVDRLIGESERFYKWGKSVEAVSEGNTNIGLCRGIKLFYEGDLLNADKILEATYNAYADENHYSGMFKAKLYLGLCAVKESDLKRLERNLSEISDILKQYK